MVNAETYGLWQLFLNTVSWVCRALKEEMDRHTATVLGEFVVRLTLVINIERGSSSGAVAFTDLATDHLETRRKLGLQLNNFTVNTQRRAPSESLPFKPWVTFTLSQPSAKHMC